MINNQSKPTLEEAQKKLNIVIDEIIKIFSDPDEYKTESIKIIKIVSSLIQADELLSQFTNKKENQIKNIEKAIESSRYILNKEL